MLKANPGALRFHVLIWIAVWLSLTLMLDLVVRVPRNDEALQRQAALQLHTMYIVRNGRWDLGEFGHGGCEIRATQLLTLERLTVTCKRRNAAGKEVKLIMQRVGGGFVARMPFHAFNRRLGKLEVSE